MTLKKKSAVVTLALLAVFAATAAQAVPPPGGGGPGGHLRIEAVSVDGNELTITGQDLDFGPGPLTVTLGGDACTVDSADANTVEATCSGLADGDYLLVVSNGNGESQNDEYDLTIGLTGADLEDLELSVCIDAVLEGDLLRAEVTDVCGDIFDIFQQCPCLPFFTKENILATCGGLAELDFVDSFPTVGAFKGYAADLCFVGIDVVDGDLACVSRGPFGEFTAPADDDFLCTELLFFNLAELGLFF